jgi:hypothetical protein
MKKYNKEVNFDPCPFIHNKYEKCYCSNLTSLNIEYFIKYCGNNYKGCYLYEEYKTKKVEKNEILV